MSAHLAIGRSDQTIEKFRAARRSVRSSTPTHPHSSGIYDGSWDSKAWTPREDEPSHRELHLAFHKSADGGSAEGRRRTRECIRSGDGRQSTIGHRRGLRCGGRVPRHRSEGHRIRAGGHRFHIPQSSLGTLSTNNVAAKAGLDRIRSDPCWMNPPTAGVVWPAVTVTVCETGVV